MRLWVTVEVLVNPNVASTCPAAWGLKLTLMGTLWPGGMVRGKFTPLILNPEPAGMMDETVMGVEPLLMRAVGIVMVWPTNTKPAHIWSGLQLSPCVLSGDPA